MDLFWDIEKPAYFYINLNANEFCELIKVNQTFVINSMTASNDIEGSRNRYTRVSSEAAITIQHIPIQ